MVFQQNQYLILVKNPAIFFTRGGYLSLGGVEIEKAE
jgi:hypothetical protein